MKKLFSSQRKFCFFEAEKRIIDLYANEDDEPYAIDVIKMPHHGSWQNQNLVRLFWVFDPEYAVISVGDYNTYGHPHQETMVLLAQAGTKVYQTNTDGDITFTSDGKSITLRKEQPCGRRGDPKDLQTIFPTQRLRLLRHFPLC